MKFLPPRDSQKWFLVMLITWFINLGALVISRYQVGASFDVTVTMALASLSLLIAFITTLGYFGVDAFTKTIVFFDLIAIFNLLFITTTRAQDGWSDITSLLNYIFFLVIGVIAGVLIQATKAYYTSAKPAVKKVAVKKPVVTKAVKKVAAKPAAKKTVKKVATKKKK